MEGDVEPPDEVAELGVIADHGLDVRGDVALGVPQQQVAEAVRLARRQHDDRTRLGRGDADVRSRREQRPQLVDDRVLRRRADERRAHEEEARGGIDELVVADDAESGAKEDAGDLVDQPDLVAAVDQEELGLRLARVTHRRCQLREGDERAARRRLDLAQRLLVVRDGGEVVRAALEQHAVRARTPARNARSRARDRPSGCSHIGSMPSVSTPPTPLAAIARSTAARISRPVSASVAQMSASSCQSSTASAAASAVDSLASVDEIHVSRAASITGCVPDDRGERIAVRHRLAERREIGRDAAHLLIAARRDAKAGLDLVEDEHGAARVAQLARAREPRLGRQPLDDRLDHDRREVGARRRRPRARARRRRRTATRVTASRTARGNADARRTPSRASRSSRSATTCSRPVYVRAIRTAAAVASAPVLRNCTVSAHGMSDAQPLRELDLAPARQRRDVALRRGLDDGLRDARLGVAERDGAERHRAVEVLSAVDVDDAAAARR